MSSALAVHSRATTPGLCCCCDDTGGGGGDDDDDDKKNLEQDDLSPGGPRVLYDRDKAKVAIHISLADGVP